MSSKSASAEQVICLDEFKTNMTDSTDFKEKEQKRPIDRIREGAASMNINVPGDDSEITRMLTFGDRLLVMKRKGVYEVKMADQIDPKRTNPNVPNTVQCLAPFGSDEEFIGKVLVLAHGLFSKGHLPANIDTDAAMVHALEITKNLGEMRLISDRFSTEVQMISENFEGRIGGDRSLVLPSIVNVTFRIREFIQKADHAFQELFDLTKLFYKTLGHGGWESLKDIIESEPRIDNFDKFLSWAVVFLRLIRNARNAIEHEHVNMKLTATDFSLNPANQLVPPLVELVHPKTPFDGTPIASFMSSACTTLADIVELMMVFLCARHVDSSGNQGISIIEIPESQRMSPHVKYGFGVMIGGKLFPLS